MCRCVCVCCESLMASGGHSLTLYNSSKNSGGSEEGTSSNNGSGGSSNNSSSPSSLLPVWTAQVPGPADLCWQMVESGQQAVQLRRRRHSQRLFHLGRTLLLKHLPRDVTEHVSVFLISFSSLWHSRR